MDFPTLSTYNKRLRRSRPNGSAVVRLTVAIIITKTNSGIPPSGVQLVNTDELFMAGQDGLRTDGEKYWSHLWILPLDLEPADELRVRTAATPGEVTRGEKRLRAADRRQYVVSHGFLRLVLARYLGMEPRTIPIVAAGHGKPRVASHPDLAFSFAYSGTVAVVAIADMPVGVDIQQVRQLKNISLIAGRIMNADEYKTWTTRSDSAKLETFFRAWTCAEARAKLGGAGLSAVTHKTSHFSGTWMRFFQPATNYYGALAARTPPKCLEIFSTGRI